MSNNPAPIIPTPPLKNLRAPLTFTAITLLLFAIAQVVIAAGFLSASTLDEAAVFTQMARWQALQQFVGCIALLLLILSDDRPNSGSARLLLPLAALAILSVTLEYFAVPYAGAGLILAVFLLALRQMLSLARAGAAVHIEQLWRIISVQWLLLWAGADAYIRLHRNPGDPSSSARSLLLLLPAVGLLPNLLMPITIRFYSILQPSPHKPRTRAWLLALLSLNAGALLTVAGPPWLSLIGTPLMLLAVPLFLLGFPPKSFRNSSLLLPLSFLLLLLALTMLLLERFKLATSSDPVPFFYSESWRHLLVCLPIFWLLTLGQIAHKKLLPQKLQSPALTLLIPLLFLAGTLLTSLFLLAATYSHDLTQLLLIGTSLELLPLLLALPLTLRTLRAIKPHREPAA